MRSRLGFTHSIVVDAPRERVWTALTDPVERNNYVCTQNQTDLRAGGAFIEEFEYGPTRAGLFLVVDPPHRLVQENFVFDRGTSHRYYNAFTLADALCEGTAPAPATTVTLDVEGFSRNDSEDWLRESMDIGWHTELRVFKAYVETGKDIRPEVWKGVLMGLRFVTANPAEDPTLLGSGVRVIDVIAGTPAERAGIRAGDLIMAVDGTPVSDFVEFRAQIRRFSPGDDAIFQVLRSGEAKSELPIVFGDAAA